MNKRPGISRKRKRNLAITAAAAALMLLCLTAAVVLFLRLPNPDWLKVKAEMTVQEIEQIVGKPTHQSRQLKQEDRWIVDSLLFNSRLVVHYRDAERPEVATNVAISRYCKVTNTHVRNVKSSSAAPTGSADE